MKWLELWVYHPEYNYSISNTGKVRSERTGKILKQGCSNGYMHVTLHKNGIGKMFYVHRLVADLHIIPIQKGFEVNHLDGNKKNNRKDNLEVVTPSMNIKHAFKIGIRKPTIGILHPNARLDENTIIRIRKLFNTTNFTHQEIAIKFGISRGHVTDIVNYRKWKHVK